MQTFLPYPSFARSAAVLDDRRLGKQRVEALQILRALHLEGYGWANHPATLMWRGHTRALASYGLAIVDEWCRRGRADTTRAPIAEFFAPATEVGETGLRAHERPPWLGWAPLHRSHRSALVRKDPASYRTCFPTVPADLPYTWPPPPAGPQPPRRPSAWVVRAGSLEQLASFRDGGLAGVPAALAAARATRKQRHQLTLFIEAVSVGDRLAILTPDGTELLVGRVTGEVAAVQCGGCPPGIGAMRPVCWGGVVPRAALVRPYQLQDPSGLFLVRGEPAVEAAEP